MNSMTNEGDEEEKSRIQASLLEGVDRDKEKSKLLESYPLLPTSLMEGKHHFLQLTEIINCFITKYHNHISWEINFYLGILVL